MTAPPYDPALSCLLGDGEMQRRIRDFDWSASGLGAPSQWPVSLQTAVSLCLSSTIPSALYIGPSGNVLYNDAWIAVIADRHPWALGRPAREVWADIWELVADQFLAVQQGETVSSVDRLLPIKRCGRVEETYWTYNLSPIRDQSGRVVAVFNQGHETTPHVLEGCSRDLAITRQRRMFDRAPGFITILSGPNHRFEFVNDAYRTRFGDREFLNRTVRDVFPELEGQGFNEKLDEVYTTGQRFVATGMPIALMQGDALQEMRYLDFVYEPLSDDLGNVTGIFCEGFDTTDRVMAERALREESRTLEILRDINATFASDLNLERIVQALTDAGTELTGAAFGSYFHNELDESGEHLKLFTLSGADRAAFEKLGHPRATPVFGPTFRNEGVVRSDDILADPRYGQFEPHRGMPKGHLPVRSYLAVSVVSRTGEVLGGLFFGHPEPQRFTDRHERLMVALAAHAAVAIDNAQLFRQVQQDKETLEERVTLRTEELLQANEQLRQAQKMEALGQLTGGIAHDFNNLLAGILGSAELLERRMQRGTLDGVDRLLSGIQISAKRAAALTQRLLAFSRRQTLDPKPTEINGLVEGMKELISRAVGPAIGVVTVLAKDVGLAKIDAAQLESSLLNLAINSRDAMPDGGLISITTERVSLDAFMAKRADLGAGEYLAITVSDTGTGIPSTHIKRIFDPFFTTKPMGQGTGLGLSMVHGFVLQSGGQIDVLSEEGAGTRFRLLLPRYEGEAQPAQISHPASTTGAKVPSGKILVVDDEPTVRMLIVEALSECGYELCEAGEGASALQQLQATRFDLLVTDVGLPGSLNGRQIADAARTWQPDLKVLFVTGYAEAAVLGNGFTTPDMTVITKPFAYASLVERVASMLGTAI